MGTFVTAVEIAKRDGPSISGPNHGQSPQDHSRMEVMGKMLLLRKGLVDDAHGFSLPKCTPMIWSFVSQL